MTDQTAPTIELLPCPFCGKTPTDYTTDAGGKWGWVQCCCNGPEVRTGYATDGSWHKDAAVEWNTRAALAERKAGQNKNAIHQGELWSFIRSVLSQGEAVWQDNKDKCFEEYSAHLDYAARKRTDQLIALLSNAALAERREINEGLLKAAQYILDSLESVAFRDSANHRMGATHPAYERLKSATTQAAVNVARAAIAAQREGK